MDVTIILGFLDSCVEPFHFYITNVPSYVIVSDYEVVYLESPKMVNKAFFFKGNSFLLFCIESSSIFSTHYFCFRCKYVLLSTLFHLNMSITGVWDFDM